MGVVITVWVASLVTVHSGFPAQAPFRAPVAACAVYGDEVPIAWTDSDTPTPFGPASIDFFATREDVRTFDVGQTPALPGPVIAANVPEPDLTNAMVWRTATVASGHYHLWSIVREPPQEVTSIQITERTPQVVTIVHAGERVGPSIAVTRPSNALATSQGEFEIRYAACDPTGTGVVDIDVAAHDGPWERLASRLPAVREGSLRWSTMGLAAGTWTIRATITDDCGGYYVGYGRYYVDVINSPDGGPRDVSEAPTVDARVVGGAQCEERWSGLPGGDASASSGDAADAGVRLDALAHPDTGVVIVTPEDSCATTSGSPAITLLGLALWLARARRRGPRRSDRAPDRAASARPRA